MVVSARLKVGEVKSGEMTYVRVTDYDEGGAEFQLSFDVDPLLQPGQVISADFVLTFRMGKYGMYFPVSNFKVMKTFELVEKKGVAKPA